MKAYDYTIRMSRMGDRLKAAESTMTVDDQRSQVRDAISALGGRSPGSPRAQRLRLQRRRFEAAPRCRQLAASSEGWWTELFEGEGSEVSNQLSLRPVHDHVERLVRRVDVEPVRNVPQDVAQSLGAMRVDLPGDLDASTIAGHDVKAEQHAMGDLLTLVGEERRTPG